MFCAFLNASFQEFSIRSHFDVVGLRTV